MICAVTSISSVLPWRGRARTRAPGLNASGSQVHGRLRQGTPYIRHGNFLFTDLPLVVAREGYYRPATAAAGEKSL